MDEVKVIILAGGCGERMGLDLPKQLFVLDDGVRVLDLTLSDYNTMPEIDSITVVYNEQYKDIFLRTCRKYDKISRMVGGGSSRQESLVKGLDKIDGKFILIHDASRPIVCERAVRECVAKIRSGSLAVHTIFPAYATMVIIKDNKIIDSVDRNEIGHLQCPVGFRKEYLEKSLALAISAGMEFKDEISMVRAAYPNFQFEVVVGHQTGFKVTYPEDIDFLRTYLQLKGKQ